MNITRKFPRSRIGIVHQNRSELTTPERGVTVVLHLKEGSSVPHCAEVFGVEMEHHAELGLWFDGKALADFDGAFALPREVGLMLTELGFTVSEDFFA